MSFIKWLNHINWRYVVTFIFLVAGFALSMTISANLYRLESGSSKTDSTMNRLTELFTSLKSAQASWGEYTLTKRYKSLDQYYDKSREIDTLFDNIYRSSSLSPQLKERMDTLGNLLNILLTKDSINPVLRYRQNAARLLDSLQVTSVRNSILADSITAVINSIHKKIQDTAGERNRSLNAWSRYLEILGYILLAIAIYLAIYMSVIYKRERSAKKRARGEAYTYHKQLENHIEELKKKNKEILRLKSMEKYTALGRVATTIGHDIKNPLTNINIALTELEESVGNEKNRLYFNMIKRNASRIKDQINHFLNVTAFTQLNTQPFSINQLLDDVLKEAADRISLEEINVKKNYDRDICEVSIDPEKIKTALLNLIFNAIEAMDGDQKTLEITTLTQGDNCVVVVEDNGSGMDENTASKIFEPYYTTKVKNGSGLGLAQTQNIILNHRGAIEVESELDRGTRFIVTLGFA